MVEIFAYLELAHAKLHFVVGERLVVLWKVVFDAIVFVYEDAGFSLDLTQANLVFL